MESIIEDMFVIRTDADTDRRYVMKKVDELTKIRNENREMSEYCPIRNFT